MKKLLAFLLALALLALPLAGCGSAPADSAAQRSPSRLHIITTIFPYYDFARAVSAPLADITMLIRPGAESHSFDPSPADILAIQEADVFIYTGGQNDAWAQTILDSIDTSGMLVLRMMDYIQPLEEETVEGMQTEDDHHHENEQEDASPHFDEHIWTSPPLAILLVQAVADAISGLDAANADTYAQNSEVYIQSLRQLDADFRQTVDASKNKLIVLADRFPLLYFTREYGLQYRAAFPGCSADSNPSAATVAHLIDTVRQNQLPCVYTIELSTGSIAAVVSEETGCDILTLQSCHNLTRAQFDAGETYLSLMQQNLQNLQKGLN